MRQLLLVRRIGSAAAVLVASRDSRVVISRNSGDFVLAQKLHDFIGPRRVAGEIAEVVYRIDVRSLVDVGENSPQRGKVSVDVGDKGVPHQERAGVAAVIRRVITTAESGHAP